VPTPPVLPAPIPHECSCEPFDVPVDDVFDSRLLPCCWRNFCLLKLELVDEFNELPPPPPVPFRDDGVPMEPVPEFFDTNFR